MRLGDVASVNPRTMSKPRSDEAVSFVPMADLDATKARTTSGTDRAFGDVATGFRIFRDADILLAKITPSFENNKIGQAQLARPVGVGSTEFHVVRPLDALCDARYLLHFLRQDWIRLEGERKMTGSGGQRRVPQKFLERLPLPLPPLDEQRRIATILDEASKLRGEAARATSQAAEAEAALYRSVFTTSESAWPTTRVEEIASSGKNSMRTGPFGSQLLKDEFTDDGIPVLGIDNVVHNEFRWGERRYITESKYEQLKRYTVHPGDVLITIMGTNGRVAIVPDDIPTAINTKHLCCISLDQEKCLPEFLHATFLWHPTARHHLRSKTKGAIMGGLNMGIIKSMPVELPPLELQREFVERLRQTQEVRHRQASRASRMDTLLSSLQSRAFRGEL